MFLTYTLFILSQPTLPDGIIHMASALPCNHYNNPVCAFFAPTGLLSSHVLLSQGLVSMMKISLSVGLASGQSSEPALLARISPITAGRESE